ncbi:DUF72 domain-containing protein [Bordetella sp. 2513F-2]
MPILTGTASWTDPTLLACGRFYPPQARDAESRLRHYASCFPMVEVDSSYYALPDPHTAHLWAQRTPPGFVFNVKAFRAFTGHRVPRDALPPDLGRDWPDAPAMMYGDDLPGPWRDELWRRFVIALEPLRMAGKLGAVQLQFAPWVRRDARGLARLDDCAGRLEGLTAAVEFRHRSWFDGQPAAAGTLARLRELGLAHTIVDAPQGSENTVPAVWETTHPDLAVVRLHGRNAATWNATGPASSSRFQYIYTPEELAELAQRVRRLAQRVQQTHAVFNTNHEDDGMRNAAGLAAALRAA